MSLWKPFPQWVFILNWVFRMMAHMNSFTKRTFLWKASLLQREREKKIKDLNVFFNPFRIKHLEITAIPCWILTYNPTWASNFLYFLPSGFRSRSLSKDGEDTFTQVWFLQVPRGMSAKTTLFCWQDFKWHSIRLVTGLCWSPDLFKMMSRCLQLNLDTPSNFTKPASLQPCSTS